MEQKIKFKCDINNNPLGVGDFVYYLTPFGQIGGVVVDCGVKGNRVLVDLTLRGLHSCSVPIHIKQLSKKKLTENELLARQEKYLLKEQKKWNRK